MSEAAFSPHIIRRFVETFSEEIGRKTLSAVLSNTELSEKGVSPAHLSELGDEHTAQAYSHLQSALRTHYRRASI